MVRRVLWVRVGNTSNRKLIELALRALPAIIDLSNATKPLSNLSGVSERAD
jgi:predicted nuclease of predicted toxin-antitoxin system